MSLTICSTQDGRLVSAAVADALHDALDEGGRGTLLVPSFSAQLDACRELAELGGLSLGVTVTTPEAWVSERWEVWGDGTRIVDAQTRRVALGMVLDGNGDGVRANPGTVEVLARLAQDGLPWLPRDEAGGIDAEALLGAGLTEAEVAAVSLLAEYERRLAAMGLVEGSSATAQVVGRVRQGGGALWPVVAVGFADLQRPRRELLAGLAAVTSVTLVTPAENPAAEEGRDRTVRLLELACERTGARVCRQSVGTRVPSRRAPELDAVLGALYGGGRAVQAGGAVSLVLPAGPLAEAEAVAGEVVRLAGEGDRRVVVVANDPSRAWRELSPKLVARGVSVRAELDERFERLEAGRAFLEFARGVARLAALDATWPAPVETEEGTLVRLGDMGWWPPRGIVDFLLSDVAGVERRQAQALDRRWRGDRLLTPAAVLEVLRNPGQTSPAVAAATAELLRGRLGSAASRLLSPLVDGAAGPDVARAPAPSDALAGERATKALEAVMGVGRTLKSLGITADPTEPGSLDLPGLVAWAERALAGISVVVRPEVEVAGAGVCVRILSPARAAQLGPASVDAVVVCGQTSAENPVGTGDDVASALLAALGVEPEARPMSEARASFWHQVACASRHVTVERALFGADSRETYPSVVLSELLACYGDAGALDAGAAARGSLPETEACRNLSPAGARPVPVASEVPAAAGSVTGGARSLINVPREGMPALPDGRPVLSASQIETYLECPYKWFSLRRLRLEDSDVGFAPVQMGTFAHRVLEVTHRTLLEEALAAMDERGEVAPDLDAHPEARVPGSRVSPDDPAGVAHAKELLAQELEAHTRHMFLRKRRFDVRNALVPHTAQDEGLLHTLRRDLESVIDYESGALVGFEPRLFEWDFGKAQLEPYAGAWIRGTVDRVDVSAHGGAVVIDYKHRRGPGLAGEYAALAPDAGDGGFSLPRHVQSLMYGQVIRRHYPDLHVVGAVYLTTGGTSHALSGAVDADQAEAVFGSYLPSKRTLETIAVARDERFGTGDERGMDALLDATEEAVAEAVARMLAGDIEAHPVDARACDWCPVMNCERRLAR